MPFAVREWPKGVDPRSPGYNNQGWAFGAVPPYHWLLKTTNATSPFEIFNDGFLIPWASGSTGTVAWELVPGVGQPVSVLMTSQGWLIEVSPIAPDTHSFVGLIDAGLEGVATFDLKQVLPTSIAEQGPLNVVGDSAFDARVPDDMTLIPAIWSFA